ncbi:hypothetical protein [Dendronalium sp. ChiSLP03b]|nr:hypothetical protein [Dendronalium sp. ChiSLP03b]
MSSPLGGFADLKELRTRRGVTPVVGGTPSRRVGSGVETPKTLWVTLLRR